MTRQHFRLIAKAIRDSRLTSTVAEQATIDTVEKRLAAVCKSFNPGFDGAKFHEACAIES